MTSIDHMVYTQPGFIPKVTGALTHERIWSATVFVHHYYDYWYAHLMRGTSSEETLRAKEAYEHLSAIHGAGVCTYRVENLSFADT